MRIAPLKIVLFALFMALPVLSLLVFGAVEPYGRPLTDFPRADQLLRGKKNKWNLFGDAVLQRSSAMQAAILLRSWISYRVVGFVSSDRVVSGEGDWLFYRTDFAAGCLDAEGMAQRLRGLAVALDLGKASGLDIIMSVSPDKSSIYPERLNQLWRYYWRCRLQSTATLRTLFKQEIPALLDHAQPLLAEKERHPDVPLFYRTDTHWTAYGAAVAFRQTVAAAFPHATAPEVRRSGDTTIYQTDLSKLLLLDVEEGADRLDVSSVSGLRALNHDAAGTRTVIAHDSFYGVLTPQLQAAFPGYLKLSLGHDERIAAEVSRADRLILNIVERSFVRHIVKGILVWDAPMMTAIVDRNVERAKACSEFAAAALRGDNGADSQIGIPPTEADRLPCLRLSLSAVADGVLEIALPNPATGAFQPGRALRYRVAAGAQSMAFVLPGYVAGSVVRLSMAGGGAPPLSSAEVGAIEAPRLASQAP